MSNERDELARTIDGATDSWLSPVYGAASVTLAGAILAAGYRKPRTITTEDEVDALPQGTKLYSPGTTHSWVLSDLSHAGGGVKVHGTGGGYTFIRDFIRQQAPLEILYEPTA